MEQPVHATRVRQSLIKVAHVTATYGRCQGMRLSSEWKRTAMGSILHMLKSHPERAS